MLLSVFFRILRLMVTSVICSLPIYLGTAELIPDKFILFFAFSAFIIETAIDACRFSFAFWKIQDYFFGQLLPLALYTGFGLLTCLKFRPVVFNRIFLPLRFAGVFGMTTSKSIVVMGVVIIATVTILRFSRAKAGREFYKRNNLEGQE